MLNSSHELERQGSVTIKTYEKKSHQSEREHGTKEELEEGERRV